MKATRAQGLCLCCVDRLQGSSSVNSSGRVNLQKRDCRGSCTATKLAFLFCERITAASSSSLHEVFFLLHQWGKKKRAHV